METFDEELTPQDAAAGVYTMMRHTGELSGLSDQQIVVMALTASDNPEARSMMLADAFAAKSAADARALVQRTEHESDVLKTSRHLAMANLASLGPRELLQARLARDTGNPSSWLKLKERFFYD